MKPIFGTTLPPTVEPPEMNGWMPTIPSLPPPTVPPVGTTLDVDAPEESPPACTPSSTVIVYTNPTTDGAFAVTPPLAVGPNDICASFDPARVTPPVELKLLST